ncbi:MAG TPA: hypothetical protein PK816_04240 [Candidatus Cloacimonadota bacterium]|nr:hypothetical protein [Candidatus Cloacimonadota bacterium]
MLALILLKEEYNKYFECYNTIERLNMETFCVDDLKNYDGLLAHQTDIENLNINGKLEIFYKENPEKVYIIFSGGIVKPRFVEYRGKHLSNSLKINVETLKANLNDFIHYFQKNNRYEINVITGGYISYLRKLRDDFLFYHLDEYYDDFKNLKSKDIEKMNQLYQEFNPVKDDIEDFLNIPDQSKYIRLRDSFNRIIIKLTNTEN